MCKKEEESINHILLHYDSARMLWQLVFSVFGIEWVIHSSPRLMLLSWNVSYIGKRRKRAWMMVPLCLFWTIWWERNWRAFN